MKHRAHVVHHIRGRIRVRLPASKGDHAWLQQLKDFISPLHGVKEVDVNPITGSVVIQYDPEAHEDFHARLSEHADSTDLFALDPPRLTEVDELAANIEKEAEYLATHSQTALAVVKFVKQINRAIREATGNTVDLKVLLPLGLAAWAYSKRHTNISTPLWVTLGISSFNSFVALHRPIPHVASPEVVYQIPEEAWIKQQQAPASNRKRSTKGT